MPVHYRKDEKFLLDGSIRATLALEKNTALIVVLLVEAKSLTHNIKDDTQ